MCPLDNVSPGHVSPPWWSVCRQPPPPAAAVLGGSNSVNKLKFTLLSIMAALILVLPGGKGHAGDHPTTGGGSTGRF